MASQYGDEAPQELTEQLQLAALELRVWEVGAPARQPASQPARQWGRQDCEASGWQQRQQLPPGTCPQ
jgi:hypothetical protein